MDEKRKVGGAFVRWRIVTLTCSDEPRGAKVSGDEETRRRGKQMRSQKEGVDIVREEWEVIEAIAECAFKTSPFPIILSFENHVDS
ncbi:1-phosphatidylinositol 4,5-bisphosphate phosphodiesterase beta-1 [Liparis tanakae]|uniref:1-phosphatidylinositol 4,5-bisphosphate phosphodiesterase beta-1 n=1 Tax=Liparis tanakae TaxID=230148 RepID=A0A4Z2E1M3_9TELE|nr:1-phosphatidylinositol 4,5-bisphosphate phosphodiesterase beta-1 [Liparis tanakae]